MVFSVINSLEFIFILLFTNSLKFLILSMSVILEFVFEYLFI